MIPIFEVDIEESENMEYSNQTYAIDMSRNIIASKCDGLEAVKQAIYLVLNTERYEYVVFTPNYGIEFNDLLGMSSIYVMSEMKRRITEALMQDDRIEDVSDFSFDTHQNRVHCQFTVRTIFGTLNSESEVII